MPSVNIVANERILGRANVFGFDFSHLPPINDESIVSSYSIKVYWYQNKDLGRPSSPSLYGPFMYDWKDGGWINAAIGGNYAAAGSKGWISGSITAYMKPLTNKLGVGISYSDFDQALGIPTTPYIKIDYTLKVIKTTLEKNKDAKENEPLTLGWTSDTTQVNYEFKYENDGITTKLSGTSEQSITIDKYILKPGSLNYQVRTFNGYVWGEWVTGSIEILEHPIHLTLEPNKIAQNKDKPIVAMWSTSDTQTQFRLLYSGTVSGEITGTTAKSHTFPAGVFSNGNVTLTLQVFNGYVWTEKTAAFMAYGAPPKPVWTTQATYATAVPSFTWTATEQVSYRIQILKADAVILDSSDIYSSSKNHKFTDVLENNTTYTARLRIRNQYEIESEWVTKTFAVAFTELQKANFDMFANDNLGTIMFNIYNAIGQSNFKHCEILRREYGKTIWNKIATSLHLTATYTDYTCRSGCLYEYKVRAIGTDGGYSDSEVGLKEISLRNTMLSDATDFSKYVVFIHNPKKGRVFTKEIHSMIFSGVKSPRFEFGDTKYIDANINFTVTEETLDKLLDLYYSNNVLMLRDSRGKKIFGHISTDISVEDAEFMKNKISFKFTETDYIEGVLV